MNNRVKHIVSQLRLSSSSRAQGPPTTMREFATQRNAGVPLQWSISKNDALTMSLHNFPDGTSGKEPACQCRTHEMPVWSLGWEGPLDEYMATHSSILAWRIPWTEEPDRLQPQGRKYLDTTGATYRTCIHEEQRVPWHSNKEAKNKYGANSLAGF